MSSILTFHDKKLFEAVKSSQLIAAKSALASGANPSLIDPTTLSPLIHICATTRQHELLRALLDAGADLTAHDREWRTAIRLCVENGLVDASRIILAHKPDLRQIDEAGDSLLHSAAARGKKSGNYTTIAQLLLSHGSAASALNGRKEIPLHHAARYGGSRMIQLLAPISNLNSADADGYTPLHAAVLGLENEDGVITLLGFKPSVNQRDRQGQSCLHLIAGKARSRPWDLTIVRALLRAGANPWIKDMDGLTAHDAASLALRQRRDISKDLIELLRPTGTPPPPEPEPERSGKKGKGKR